MKHWQPISTVPTKSYYHGRTRGLNVAFGEFTKEPAFLVFVDRDGNDVLWMPKPDDPTAAELHEASAALARDFTIPDPFGRKGA